MLSSNKEGNDTAGTDGMDNNRFKLLSMATNQKKETIKIKIKFFLMIVEISFFFHGVCFWKEQKNQKILSAFESFFRIKKKMSMKANIDESYICIFVFDKEIKCSLESLLA